MRCICFRKLDEGEKEFLNQCGSALCKRILSHTVNGVPFEYMIDEVKNTDKK